MKLKDLCKKRKIPKMQRFSTETPLLVPSFSSNISFFEKKIELQELYDNIKESTPYTSLISAYDLYHEKLKYESIFYSDLTFIDSGNYEYLNQDKDEMLWNSDLYFEVLSKLKPTSTISIISFDKYCSYKEQLKIANETFHMYPDSIHDFLLKPENSPKDVNELIWNFQDIKEHIEVIGNFDIIGITEKDLGFTLYERCQNLIVLRCLLDPETPIHIFGCDDPQTILIYNLLEGDIFDGTSWTRFYFWRGYAMYLKHFSLISSTWTDRVGYNNIRAITKNLDQMRRFQSNLHQFINTNNFDLINFSNKIIHNVKIFLNELGVEY